MSLFHLFRTEHPTEMDEHFHIYDRGACLNSFYWGIFFSQLKEITFDTIVECGVGRGKSLISLLAFGEYMIESKQLPRHLVYALDSFAGFPTPSAFDHSSRNPKKGEWALSPSGMYRYSPRFLKAILRHAGLSGELPRLKILKGFFRNSCRKIPRNRKIGLLHLDGDLYESIQGPLEILSPLLVKGGIIVFDDFLTQKSFSQGEKFPGARKACDEFLKKHKGYCLHSSIRGTPFLIKK